MSTDTSSAHAPAEHRFHLAQLNVGAFRAPRDAPGMADFTEGLAPVNALADAAPGFVWRFIEGGRDDATESRPFGPDILINLSTWEDRDSLWNFTYRTLHLDYLRRRREWFHHPDEVASVLWWVPAGHRPGTGEAGERLHSLRTQGPTPAAFTFRDFFSPSGDSASAPHR